MSRVPRIRKPRIRRNQKINTARKAFRPNLVSSYQMMVCNGIYGPGNWNSVMWNVVECIQDGLTVQECMDSILATR